MTRRIERLHEMPVTITAVDWGSGILIVQDKVGNEFEVDGKFRPKGMGFPEVGERWLLARKGSVWVLDTQIGAPAIQVVEGSRDGMHPVSVQVLEALARQGLVLDQTVGPIIRAWDDETDPVIPDPADEQWEDAFDEGVPVGPDVDPPPASTGNHAPKPPPKPPKDEDPPKGHNDDPESGSEVAADLISIVSFNQYHGVGPKRARADLHRLWKQADLLGLQECHGAQRKQVLDSHPDNWGLYQPNTAPEPPLMWREGVFDHLDSNSQTLSPSDGSGSARPERAINWVRLRHRGTKDQLVFVNYHWENAAAFRGYFDPHSRPSAARHVERYKHQMDQVIPLMRNLGRFGPIIFTGDWNVTFRQDLRLRNPGLPTASFRRINMRSNWDINGLPPIGTHGGIHGSVFDAVFLRNRVPGQVQFLHSKVLRDYESDHRPVLVRARIKNLRHR